MADAAVSIGDQDFERADLVVAGFLTGEWPSFERSVGRGLALERAGGPSVDAVAIREVAISFRRVRGLVAADQLDAWLAERHVSHDELTAYLRRQVLREREHVAADDPVSTADVVEILNVEATLGGLVGRCAATVVAWAAAAGAAGPGPDPTDSDTADLVASSAAARVYDGLTGDNLARRLGRLERLRAGHGRFVAQVAGDRAIADCLARHRLDWMAVRCVEIVFADDGAAREGMLCIREDGLDPTEVASLAGAGLTERTVVLEREPALIPFLESAQRGDVAGPLAGSRVLVVVDRVPPSAEDPALRARARDELVAGALETLTAGKVRWHGAL